MYPTVQQTHDDDLKQRILCCVRGQGETGVEDLQVDVLGGIATLSGRIDSRDHARFFALCQHVPGVLRVIDATEVAVPQ